ncbi:threonine dehydrogenase-like Zn-dependent dehydrogenase [Hasllibacter halocynthiae]|uniref:Threonine dehydrogenase-like Zn-dependent dehydrogenase n=1 Tax=Hasllibacter halocynthiae TaxID=595589 RepID=A0A2T0X3H1_9RHOB|nr:zinc-dependent alcohol dehydrogenase [Hasllibacter halocynthiae]PRY93467.1 threonine dehydrogenase-like Zn-dependent dehydrogenase [Hasllibacter halocynthiae]
MRAVTYHGTGDFRVDTHPDPGIEHPRDAVIRVTSTAICGSDLHMYDGFIPEMRKGDIIGHEFMGVVEEVGPEAAQAGDLKKGDRILIPFTIACGSCAWCRKQEFSLCDESNRDAEKLAKLNGQASGGLFGYSHLYGGYDGGQAEYVRVPFADTTHMKVPEGMADEQVLFLTDIFPTGWQAAVNAQVGPGDTVAIWGAGPVGLFCLESCKLLGAERIFVVDDVPERLEMARARGAEPVDRSEVKPYDFLREATGGRMPAKCIDAVGLESHGSGVMDAVYDRIKTATFQETGRPHVLREAILCCSKGGIVSIPGVYAAIVDKFPIGAAFAKGLTFRMGQTHVLQHTDVLLDHIREGRVDPTFLITHRGKLGDAPDLYETFRDKKDDCIKVVLTP